MAKPVRYQSPLARVVGLGSAQEGTAHWWWQRLTAVALVPLTLWFVYAIAAFAGECSGNLYAWIASPWTSTLMIAFVFCLFYHAVLGVQVVIEDYVHNEAAKIVSIWAIKFIAVLLVLSSMIAILRLALSS